jgi:4-hydroxybenzoate polyprenyltransferase
MPITLLFFPCLFGLAIGITKLEQLWYAPLFLAGSIIMRSAGCIINDIFDRKIDAKVDRTKDRPLASGALSPWEALFILVILMLAGLMILMMLPRLAIMIGLISVPLIIIYPLMKRITYWPQLLLGMTFGSIGVLIAYATVRNTIDLPALMLYLGCVFWTLGYDCIYAFMDIKDDRKVGVKSIALFLEKRRYDIWLMSFYLIFLCCMSYGMSLAGIHPFFVIYGNFSALAILTWQISTLDVTNPENCMLRFKVNGYVGLSLGLSLVIDKVLYL